VPRNAQQASGVSVGHGWRSQGPPDTALPSRGSTLQQLDAAMGATPQPPGRRRRHSAAPPRSAVRTAHGHGRSRRRQRPAWGPPGDGEATPQPGQRGRQLAVSQLADRSPDSPSVCQPPSSAAARASPAHRTGRHPCLNRSLAGQLLAWPPTCRHRENDHVRGAPSAPGHHCGGLDFPTHHALRVTRRARPLHSRRWRRPGQSRPLKRAVRDDGLWNYEGQGLKNGSKESTGWNPTE
jgi:hypothetical protein